MQRHSRNSTLRLLAIASATSAALMVTLTGCGPAPLVGSGSPVVQLTGPAAPAPTHPTSPARMTMPQVARTERVLTIQSDVSGPEGVAFSLDLELDARGEIVFMRFYRNGKRGPDPVAEAGVVSPEARRSACSQNSRSHLENCVADAALLTGEGIVVERFYNRPGVTLMADKDFSMADGGNLVLRYVHDSKPEDSSHDVVGEYRLKLEHTPDGWGVYSAISPEWGAINQIRLKTAFAGGLACGLETLDLTRVGEGSMLRAQLP
jgi:hypothetical protein